MLRLSILSTSRTPSKVRKPTDRFLISKYCVIAVCLESARFRVENLTNAVADQVEHQHGNDDGDAGEGAVPPGIEKVGAAGRDQQAPFGRWWLGAQPQEAQRGDSQDHSADIHGGLDGHRG